jgi:hypothetical protein
MPRIGVAPSINGLSWFGVEVTWSEPPFTTSHVQPEPKRFTPASFSFALTSSTPSKAAAIAPATAPDGSPPPPGFMTCQKSEWLACPPPLFRAAVRRSSGNRSSCCTSSAIGVPSSSVPSTALFRLSTYA